MNQKLRYRSSTRERKEDLPIGNGRLAGMILGCPEIERIALNHEWLWRGINRDRDNEFKSHYLKKVRGLLLEGKYE
ncbi:MAG: hypothetical protein GX974_08320 [Clostridiales bacterium]|nr:hypothetical protein [Clostridiales bacterium]